MIKRPFRFDIALSHLSFVLDFMFYHIYFTIAAATSAAVAATLQMLGSYVCNFLCCLIVVVVFIEFALRGIIGVKICLQWNSSRFVILLHFYLFSDLSFATFIGMRGLFFFFVAWFLTYLLLTCSFTYSYKHTALFDEWLFKDQPTIPKIL